MSLSQTTNHIINDYKSMIDKYEWIIFTSKIESNVLHPKTGCLSKIFIFYFLLYGWNKKHLPLCVKVIKWQNKFQNCENDDFEWNVRLNPTAKKQNITSPLG